MARRIKKRVFSVKVPEGTSPELFAMMFVTQVPGTKMARPEGPWIRISCLPHQQQKIKQLARRFAADVMRDYPDKDSRIIYGDWHG
jgi:hypothetical protein